jgi:hypothetical protein
MALLLGLLLSVGAGLEGALMGADSFMVLSVVDTLESRKSEI